MDTTIWGPPFWKVLHCLSWRLRASDRVMCATFVDMIHALRDVLPCKYCRESLRVFTTHTPVTAAMLWSEERCHTVVAAPDSPEAIRRAVAEAMRYPALAWTWHLHDLIDSKLAKPTLPFSKLAKRLCSGGEICTPDDVLAVLSCVANNFPDHDSARSRAYTRFDAALAALFSDEGAGCQDGRQIGADRWARLRLMGGAIRAAIEAHPNRSSSHQHYSAFLRDVQAEFCNDARCVSACRPHLYDCEKMFEIAKVS